MRGASSAARAAGTFCDLVTQLSSFLIFSVMCTLVSIYIFIIYLSGSFWFVLHRSLDP